MCGWGVVWGGAKAFQGGYIFRLKCIFHFSKYFYCLSSMMLCELWTQRRSKFCFGVAENKLAWKQPASKHEHKLEEEQFWLAARMNFLLWSACVGHHSRPSINHMLIFVVQFGSRYMSTCCTHLLYLLVRERLSPVAAWIELFLSLCSVFFFD